MSVWTRLFVFSVAIFQLASASANEANCFTLESYPEGTEYCLLYGDLDGDGEKEPVQYYEGQWTFGELGNGQLTAGQPGDQPVLGDWDGDGKDTIGIYRNGHWLLTNDDIYLVAPEEFQGFEIESDFGNAKHQPVTGDWNGNGKDTLGVVSKRGVYKVTNQLVAIQNVLIINLDYGFNDAVVGDFDQDGDDEVGGAFGEAQFWHVNDIAQDGGAYEGEVVVTGTNVCPPTPGGPASSASSTYRFSGQPGAFQRIDPDPLDVEIFRTAISDNDGNCPVLNNIIIEIIP